MTLGDCDSQDVEKIVKGPLPHDDQASADAEGKDLANASTAIENASKRQDIEARAEYAPKSFSLIVLWLPAVYLVVLF